MLRKYLFKDLQKLDENVDTVTKNLQKRTTITGITRIFTQNKFPRQNLSQRSAHIFAKFAMKIVIILQNL